LGKAWRIHIDGIIQGVGFRPFVYKLAQEYGIKGWVNNASDGVDIHAQGERVEEFYQDLRVKKPPLAFILGMSQKEVSLENYPDFKIVASRKVDKNDVLISPDVAVCPDCVREMMDPADRRYLYPFINCTNCGPRYSIIYDRPYDRSKTTMKEFEMCPQCHQEYENPLDRRFHAQPIACSVCGPKLQLVDDQGREITGQGIGLKLLAEGAIMAVKGIGGFHLVCDVYHEEAVQRLRSVKERGAKPFALMARNVQTAAKEVEISPLEEELLLSPSAPIVLLTRIRSAESKISGAVAPGLHTLGIMLPYTPVHHLLFAEGFDFLVMTSANLSGQPLIYKNEVALSELKGIADYFLLNDREIYHPCDDSVIQVIGGKPAFMRRARGYVPLPLILKEEINGSIIGLGAEMKNAFCLAAGKMAFMSQYIGDMHGYENFERFKSELQSYQKAANIFPDKVAYDLHPEYATTKLAKAMAYPKYAVQHHHAHHVGVMGEYGLHHPIMGLICDGTGYGADGKIWGFEYIYGDAAQYVRKGQLEYLPLPGGDAGSKYPLRIAYAYLQSVLSKEEWLLTENLWQKLTAQERNILDSQLKSGFQIFETSSAGRLFDAVSGILDICTEVTYEGQAAIELESRATVWFEELKCHQGTQAEPDLKLGNFGQEAGNRINRTIEILEKTNHNNQEHVIDIATQAWDGNTDRKGSRANEKLTEKDFKEKDLNDLVKEYNSAICNNEPILYSIILEVNSEVVQIKIGRLLRELIDDILTGMDHGEIAYKFHYSLACAMLETALILGLEQKEMVVGGGVFQNKLLTEILFKLARTAGITLYYPRFLPPGDGGLALGQILVANEVLKGK